MRLLGKACVALAVAIVAAPAGFAQDVRAELSSSSAAVGEPVEFTITATGKAQARLMDEFSVDGIELASNTSQFQMQMGFPNLSPKVSTVWRLILVPTREGQFSIPPLRVSLGGKVFKTLPSVLSVSGQAVQMPGGLNPPRAIPVPGGGGGGVPQVQTVPPGSQQQARDDSSRQRPYFGEMVVPKQSAFVGEFVPVELRFYLLSRAVAEFSDRPQFSGEGFTVQRFEKPAETRRVIDGTEFGCIVFKTAITAAKAGNLDIPPALLDARVQVQSQAPVPRGMDPFFGNLLQNFGVAEVKQIQIPTNGAQIEVKPLPKEGKPEGFEGAIGNFKIETAASPTKAAAGEPVVLRVKVSGRGNFEAMGAPRLVDAEGWRVYDPSEKFTPSPSDPTGYIGEKVYEFTMVARQDQKTTPAVQFSFFDTEAEKYVTLDGAPVPVDAKGSGAAATAPATAASSPTPEQTRQPTPSAPHADLSRNFARSEFRPAAWSPGYLIAGGVLLALWVAGLLVAVARRFAQSPGAAEAARLRGLRGGLKALAAPEIPDIEFLEGVAKFVEHRFGEFHPDAWGLDDGAAKLLAETRTKYESAKFSTAGVGKIDHDLRKKILSALKAADASFGKSK